MTLQTCIAGRALEALAGNWSSHSWALSLLGLFRDHVRNRYPGSRHWDPSKISLAEDHGGNGSGEARLDVGIPGASRAYHDVDIYPKNGAYLAIPLLPQAQGVSPRLVPGLFRPWKRGGGERADVLALKEGSALVFMYALSKHVHQAQDPTLLPTEEDIVRKFAEDFCGQGDGLKADVKI